MTRQMLARNGRSTAPRQGRGASASSPRRRSVTRHWPDAGGLSKPATTPSVSGAEDAGTGRTGPSTRESYIEGMIFGAAGAVISIIVLAILLVAVGT